MLSRRSKRLSSLHQSSSILTHQSPQKEVGMPHRKELDLCLPKRSSNHLCYPCFDTSRAALITNKVFGLEHDHQYIYGRNVVFYIDHKPLVSISCKSLASAPKRLQRLLLCLHQYDIEIIYRPGREMYLADTLSRDRGDHLKVVGLKIWPARPGGGGGGTPIYGLYRYVPRDRVWFLRFSVLK